MDDRPAIPPPKITRLGDLTPEQRAEQVREGLERKRASGTLGTLKRIFGRWTHLPPDDHTR